MCTHLEECWTGFFFSFFSTFFLFFTSSFWAPLWKWALGTCLECLCLDPALSARRITVDIPIESRP